MVSKFITSVPASFAAALLLGAAPAPEPLSRAEVAKLAKPASAMVIVKQSRFGSSFCIHPSGLFVTNEHVVADLGADGTADLVLDSGLSSEKTLKAKVVRRDKGLDLALLQAEGGGKFAALKLGSDESLTELTELIAFGFPFGAALAKPGEKPAITINVVNVSALRTDAKKELARIQLDSNLNPGNSGGPVIDRFGKVMGVVVGGIRGTGINVAIPVRHVHQFLDRPVFAFKPPLLTATMESVRDGKFIKPLQAASPASYLKSVSTPGDYIGQGKTYSYEEKDLRLRGFSNRVSVDVDGWNIEFAAPRGGAIKAGEYPNARRYPFNDDAPGLNYSGHSRGSNKVGGHFVIWELEMKGNQVVRFAVDFIHRSEETGPPLYGMLRYNSTFE